MNRASLTRDFGPILRLLRNGIGWLYTRWQLFDVLTLRRDFMHPDIPALVIAERELRP